MQALLLEADLGKHRIWRPIKVLYRYANRRTIICTIRRTNGFTIRQTNRKTTRLSKVCLIRGNDDPQDSEGYGRGGKIY